ncbi:MAG TPA: hypothetical protein VKS60_13755 [Stellaceae bacterium]|nr:hypothetical protein [Stellaceae bacterium]
MTANLGRAAAARLEREESFNHARRDAMIPRDDSGSNASFVELPAVETK